MSHTTSTPAAVRVTVRASANHYHREMDISLPQHVSLSEVLEEVTDLMNAPTISKPWQFTTAGGKALDHSAPLAETSIEDGCLILLSPHTLPPAPVIRDAAEALTQSPLAPQHNPFVEVWSLCALASVAAFMGTLLTWPVALAVVAVYSFGLQLWSPKSTFLAVVTVACTTVAAGLYIGELHLGLIAAAISGWLTVGILHITGLSFSRLTACTSTTSLLGLAAALGGFLPGLAGESHVSFIHAWQVAGAGTVILCTVAIIAIAPGVTTRWAGLEIPQLPSADETTTATDIDYSTMEVKAKRAQHLYEGTLLGAAISTAPAFFAIALSAGVTGFAVGLSLTVLIGVLLHAVRHDSLICQWSLTAIALQSAVSVSVLALFHPTWVFLAIAGILLLCMATILLWSPHVPEMEPTTMVWVERAESLCITAIIPLCLHLGGVFVWIRSLG